MPALFITGTDTDVGKSLVTLGLALALEQKGHSVCVYKPLQSGAVYSEEKSCFIAPDLALIEKYSLGIQTKYSYLLEGECSPALAGHRAKCEISLDKIADDYAKLCESYEYVLVEGAGGLLCPVSFTPKYTMLDVIQKLDIPCVVVARPNLGTINHTLLTDSVLHASSVLCKGIIINNYPSNTTDIAVQNVHTEIALYAHSPILCTIPKLETLTKEHILMVFEDKVHRVIG